MSRKYGRALTLANIPDEEWQLLAHRGFDLVWLMGVWQRSPGARQKALLHPALRREYNLALPGWAEQDVDGSPYAVFSYNLNPLLGEPTELAELKSKLNRQGMGLVLDFVPNHLALDHPWTSSYPERFILGKRADAEAHPEWFFSFDEGIYFAHGRDPYFPPWADTVQVNFYSSELREALIKELLQIVEVADGVRCDMAMLALNDVFEEVWGEFAKAHRRPDTEFWVEAIARVKQRRPDFLFIAEVYWGLERKLQDIGFDFTYDKPLYDKLRSATASGIKSHLMMNELYHEHSLHFLENHDEERAVVAFGREASLAAAAVIATIPGLRLFHDGQLEGRRTRLPIQLMREPEEPLDLKIWHFYDQLMTVCRSPAFHEGQWQMMDVRQAMEENRSHQDLLAWRWLYAGQVKIVIVNYSPRPAQGWLRLPLKLDTIARVLVRDNFTGNTFAQDAQQVRSQGLHLELNPWQVQILDIDFRFAK